MRRAITLLFLGNVVALERQIDESNSYSRTTAAAFPAQIEMVQSIHDSARLWHVTAVDEEKISLLKTDLEVASPTPLIDGETGYYLERTLETTPMSTNSGYTTKIRSDDKAGGPTLFPRQVNSSESGPFFPDVPTFLRSAADLSSAETTSTNGAPGTSSTAPENSLNSESTPNFPSTASSGAVSESQSPFSATRTSPAPNSASQTEEASAGSTPTSLPSNSEAAVPSSDGGPAVSSPGDQSDSPFAPSTIAIGPSATLPPFQISRPVIPLPGATLTPISAEQFGAGNQTLIPGGSAISISGTAISLDPSASEIVVGGTSTISVVPATFYQAQQPPPTISLAGTTITLNSDSGYVVGTQTLIAGGPVITISGTAVSLDSSTTEIVVGGTSTVNLAPTINYEAAQPPAISLPGTTITLNSNSKYVAGTQTLLPGGPVITILGTAVSLGPSAMDIVIGGTSTIDLAPITVYEAPQPSAISLAGTTITLNSESAYVAGTQTLMPGGPVITIMGTAVSLDPSGTAVVVSAITAVAGASGFITRGPGGTQTRYATAMVTVEGYTGVASNNKVDGFGWWIFAFLFVVHMCIN